MQVFDGSSCPNDDLGDVDGGRGWLGHRPSWGGLRDCTASRFEIAFQLFEVVDLGFL